MINLTKKFPIYITTFRQYSRNIVPHGIPKKTSFWYSQQKRDREENDRPQGTSLSDIWQSISNYS